MDAHPGHSQAPSSGKRASRTSSASTSSHWSSSHRSSSTGHGGTPELEGVALLAALHGGTSELEGVALLAALLGTPELEAGGNAGADFACNGSNFGTSELVGTSEPCCFGRFLAGNINASELFCRFFEFASSINREVSNCARNPSNHSRMPRFAMIFQTIAWSLFKTSGRSRKYISTASSSDRSKSTARTTLAKVPLRCLPCLQCTKALPPAIKAIKHNSTALAIRLVQEKGDPADSGIWFPPNPMFSQNRLLGSYES